MKASLAELESHRRLHPHPRVTAVAKKTATAAPLALSRKRARNLRKEAVALSYSKRARDLRKALKQAPTASYRFIRRCAGYVKPRHWGALHRCPSRAWVGSNSDWWSLLRRQIRQPLAGGREFDAEFPDQRFDIAGVVREQETGCVARK